MKKILWILIAIIIIAVMIIFNKNTPNQKEIPNVPYIGGPHGNLSEVKVATVYEKTTDRESGGGRSLENTVKILKATQTDFIFLGFYTWTIPAPESPDNMPPELLNRIAMYAKTATKNVPELVRATGYSYEELRNSILAVKKEMPGVIFNGGIPAEALGRIEVDPMTNSVISADNTWAMAFDPKKWGISYICEDICKDYPSLKGKLLDKEGFQEYFALSNHLLKQGEKYDWQKAEGYYPDLTNPAFQELIINRAKKQIDFGADSIFIDLLYIQAESLKAMVNNNENHPAVRESYDAASKIIDEIHQYGKSKGKYIYVGSWSEPVINYSWLSPKLDFVTITPLPEEILSGKFDEDRWDKLNLTIEKKFGKIPRFVFIDFGWANNSPMDVFSQKLSIKQQREWLGKADEFFQSKDMIFMYPIHGADFTPGAKRLSFGKHAKYDSLAPEFDTYDTIKELANKKASK